MSHAELIGWIAIALYIQAWMVIGFVTWRAAVHANRIDAAILREANRLHARIDRLESRLLATGLDPYRQRSDAVSF